jgi:hypothetical protein
VARRTALSLFLAAGLAAIVAAVALAAGNYSGTAQDIALTAGQAKYKAVTGAGVAAKPPANKLRGYRTGWQTSYLRGTVAKPIEALSLIYVYATPADAQRAFANSCSGCSKSVRIERVLMKYQLTSDKPPGVVNIATCRNLYVASVVSGDLKPGVLAEASGALAGTVFAKAAATGMSPCTNG